MTLLLQMRKQRLWKLWLVQGHRIWTPWMTPNSSFHDKCLSPYTDITPFQKWKWRNKMILEISECELFKFICTDAGGGGKEPWPEGKTQCQMAVCKWWSRSSVVVTGRLPGSAGSHAFLGSILGQALSTINISWMNDDWVNEWMDSRSACLHSILSDQAPANISYAASFKKP